MTFLLLGKTVQLLIKCLQAFIQDHKETVGTFDQLGHLGMLDPFAFHAADVVNKNGIESSLQIKEIGHCRLDQ